LATARRSRFDDANHFADPVFAFLKSQGLLFEIAPDVKTRPACLEASVAWPDRGSESGAKTGLRAHAPFEGVGAGEALREPEKAASRRQRERRRDGFYRGRPGRAVFGPLNRSHTCPEENTIGFDGAFRQPS